MNGWDAFEVSMSVYMLAKNFRCNSKVDNKAELQSFTSTISTSATRSGILFEDKQIQFNYLHTL